MTKEYKPEDVKISIMGEEVKGFIAEPENYIPFITIILDLPDGKKTGLSLNTENLIRKIYELFPLQFKELIKEIQDD